VAERLPIAPIIAGGDVSVVAFDVLGSLICKATGMSYDLLWPGSVIIYGTVAALVGRRRDWHTGLFAGFAMGGADLTGGWWVTWMIGPGRPASGFSWPTILAGAMSALAIGGIVGSIGSWVGVRISHLRGPAA
jgi:hypothetical protein